MYYFIFKQISIELNYNVSYLNILIAHNAFTFYVEFSANKLFVVMSLFSNEAADLDFLFDDGFKYGVFATNSFSPKSLDQSVVGCFNPVSP